MASQSAAIKLHQHEKSQADCDGDKRGGQRKDPWKTPVFKRKTEGEDVTKTEEKVNELEKQMLKTPREQDFKKL